MWGMNTKSQTARAKWAGLIAEQAGSGLSVPRFCAGRSIAAASMFSWRRKLALEACAAQGAAGGFVEARVLGEGGGLGNEPRP